MAVEPTRQRNPYSLRTSVGRNRRDRGAGTRRMVRSRVGPGPPRLRSGVRFRHVEVVGEVETEIRFDHLEGLRLSRRVRRVESKRTQPWVGIRQVHPGVGVVVLHDEVRWFVSSGSSCPG